MTDWVYVQGKQQTLWPREEVRKTVMKKTPAGSGDNDSANSLTWWSQDGPSPWS